MRFIHLFLIALLVSFGCSSDSSEELEQRDVITRLDIISDWEPEEITHPLPGDTQQQPDTIPDNPDIVADEIQHSSSDIQQDHIPTYPDDVPTEEISPEDIPDDPGEPTPEMIGCSDGTREGFLDIEEYPNVAACSGAWTVPGIHHSQDLIPVPSCGRQAGNDGVNRSGTGCNVEDLCADGWHVCRGRKDVLTSTGPLGCDEIMLGAQSPAFFLSRTSSLGQFNCTADISDSSEETISRDDIFGCGDLGCPIVEGEFDTCLPLQVGSHDLCRSLRNIPGCNCSKQANGTISCPSGIIGCGWCHNLDYWGAVLGVSLPDVWDCGTHGSQEANHVTKTNPDQQGGVMCCRN